MVVVCVCVEGAVFETRGAAADELGGPLISSSFSWRAVLDGAAATLPALYLQCCHPCLALLLASPPGTVPDPRPLFRSPAPQEYFQGMGGVVGALLAIGGEFGGVGGS